MLGHFCSFLALENGQSPIPYISASPNCARLLQVGHMREDPAFSRAQQGREQCVTVPKMLNNTDTGTFSVPNFSDTGSETFFRYQILPISSKFLNFCEKISSGTKFFKMPVPRLFPGTKFFRYRFRDFFPVPFFPIPVPIPLKK